MKIKQFTMEDVRCFDGRQTFEIRPLTFLVGENSTGKTTALGCFQVLANYFNRKGADLNCSPYSMGTFGNIVRNSGKTKETFTLGFTSRHEKEKEDVELIVEFVEKKRGVEPVAKSVTVKFTDGAIILNAVDTMERDVQLDSFDEAQNQYRVDVYSRFFYNNTHPFAHLDRFAYKWAGEGRSEKENALVSYLNKKHGILRDQLWPWRMDLPVFSASPVRSQPKRTYDPTREFNDPEGRDLPMRLMRIQETEKDEWKVLKEQLVKFGKSSGLFQNIEVKHFGGSMSNPFQLKVEVRGSNSNIIDVGYGVSQILPILVYIFDPLIPRQQRWPSFFLLQQPEIHLHPRAQAELSSLLAATVHQPSRRSFIIETHSDYMIDRSRIEVQKGNLRPEDLSLIYLESKENAVQVHNICFDKMGNMEGVPPGYRDFFMEEADRLMGFED